MVRGTLVGVGVVMSAAVATGDLVRSAIAEGAICPTSLRCLRRQRASREEACLISLLLHWMSP